MTGQAIIKAILKGERDPQKLAALRDWRVKASAEQIAQSLEGNWQPDLLFLLQQEQDGYEFCQQQMVECDRRLEQYLHQREDRSQGAPLPQEKWKERLKKKKGNKPQFDLREGLFRMSGTDLTQIDGIDVMTATTVLSEAGYDMSKWQTENHFVSWLRLCPDNRISGNKIIGKGRLPTNNPISIDGGDAEVHHRYERIAGLIKLFGIALVHDSCRLSRVQFSSSPRSGTILNTTSHKPQRKPYVRKQLSADSASGSNFW